MKKKFYVYALIDPRSGRVFYVGKGTGNRAQRHLCDCISGNHYNPKLGRKIAKIRKFGLTYGVEFLFSSDDERACFEKEVFYIAFFGRKGLCNLTDGGEGLRNPSIETRAILAALHKAENNHWFGKTFSDEHRNKISATLKGKPAHNKGKPATNETKSKLSAARIGRPSPTLGKKWTQESRDRLSAAMTGRKLSEEHKTNLSAALAGKPRRSPSLESRARRSENQKGRKHSEASRTKMRLAAVVREAAKRASKLQSMAV